MRKKLKP